jgi:hypothetical protein
VCLKHTTTWQFPTCMKKELVKDDIDSLHIERSRVNDFLVGCSYN